MTPAALPLPYVPFRRVTFGDSDELADSFASWGMELTLLRPESETAWTASGTFGSLNVRSTALSGRYRVRTGLPPSSLLVQLDLGTARSRRLGKHVLAANDILVGCTGGEIDGVLTEGHHGMSFVIPEDLVAEALTFRAPEAVTKAIRPASTYVLSNAARQVTALRRLARQTVEQDNAPSVDSSVVLEALIDALVDPWESDTDVTFRVPRTHCLPIVRRVEEFMRDNLGEPLMLHDLCRVARASQRTVEYAFSSVYGLGPKQYLKLLRLNEVRRALKSESDDGTSISNVARFHGFLHMGHFFTDYRSLFDETPEQTRRPSA